MLSRDNVIQTALLKLGEVEVYNNNKSDIYKIANKLLDNVLDTVATKNDFLFNSSTVTLTKYGETVDGEFIYNKPIDFLNKITFLKGEGRIENEFIYSNSEDLQLRYCKKISFYEVANYMQDYLIYALATELAETYTQYTDRLEVLNTRLEQERNNIYRVEFSAKTRKL